MEQPDHLLELLESPSPHASTWGGAERCDTKWLNYVYRSGTVRAQFFDRQDTANPLNGVTLRDPDSLRRIVRDMRNRPPFLSELIGTNGRKLLLGLGSSDGCAQFSSTDGEPPYLMAVRDDPERGEGEQDFLMANTPTPVPRRYCLPMQKVTEIAAAFLENGERSRDVKWEEI